MTGIFQILPLNFVSLVAGRLAFLRLPKTLLLPLLRAFAKHYAVNLTEASRELADYDSLGDFFIRDLKPGSRNIAPGIISPVDGTLTEHGKIEDDRLLQVKGSSYLLGDLLRDEDLVKTFRGGYFVTIYLAPGDYHQVHSPLSGSISGSQYIPGRLFPVNAKSCASVERLFCRNERIVTTFESEYGTSALITVGALNVGCIDLRYDPLRTNSPSRVFSRTYPIEKRDYAPAKPIARGAQLATFRLGSTVILLFEAGRINPGERCRPGKIKLGERLDENANV